MTVWATSDNHYDHKNIIKYTGRKIFMNKSEVSEYNEIMKVIDEIEREHLIRRMKISEQSVNKMNEVMIKNWNSVVKPEDTIYHLGDFALTSAKRCEYFINRLNGYKILILGNHDKSVDRMKELGFPEVYKNMLIYDGKILTHEPISIKGRVCINVSVDNFQFTPIPMPKVRNVILCGHVHGSWLLRGDTKNGSRYKF